MQSELALTTELYASCLRPLATFTRSREDQMPLELSQATLALLIVVAHH
jgi:hypothetical protein